MSEALETLIALRIIFEMRGEHRALAQINSDIKQLESDIRKYQGR